MTTKTVAVQLVAMTSQYQASMAKATASTAKLQGTAAATSKGIGSVMGPQIAVAGAVVAGAAVKMALDWEDAFTKIGAITDSSQAQVEQWKSQVLTLAGTTAQAPKELADALYFLASAGLDASQIMPTLEASAKASAVGLGETADIARITANALNAYAGSGLEAAQVTDILVAAVREGTAEPDEFADALGRILPIASKAGVSFDEVAASLSSLSNIGLDVNEGVTAMRGLMQALVNTTPKAAAALADMGISTDELRTSLSEDGLIATLRMLDEAAGGNVDVLGDVIGNVRALTGAFGLTQQEAEKVDEIFRDVMNSTGDLGRSFDKTAESPGHKLRQALTDLNVVMIQLGDDILPGVVTGLEAVAAVAGPLVDVLHGLAAAYDFLKVPIPGFDKSKITQREVDLILEGATAEEAHAIALGHTGDAAKSAGGQAAYYAQTLADAAGAATEAKPPIEGLSESAMTAAGSMDQAETDASDFAMTLATLAGIALDAEDAAIGWNQALIDMRTELKGGEKSLSLTSQAGIDNREAFKSAAEAAIAHGEAVAQQSGSVEKGTEVVADHIAQLRNQAIQAGFTEEEIDAYIRKLNLTPKQIRTLIKLDAERATAEAEAYFNMLISRDGLTVQTYVNQVTTTEGREVGHTGGIVGSLPRYHRGGTVKGDERVVVARKGEHILTASQYKALASAKSVHVGGQPQQGGPDVRVAFRLDRRRFTDELDHDAAYAGHW